MWTNHIEAIQLSMHISTMQLSKAAKTNYIKMQPNINGYGYMSQENLLFAYAKTNNADQQPISAFVFTTHIVQPLYFLNLKVKASKHFLWLYSPVCVGLGWKPQRQVFSRCGSYDSVANRNENIIMKQHQ